MNMEARRLMQRNYQRRLLKENPVKYYKDLSPRTKRWRAKYPEKRLAHQKVFVEIRAGRMTKGRCFCGKKGEAHHEDYSKPLEVKWYCKPHHRIADRKDLPLVVHSTGV